MSLLYTHPIPIGNVHKETTVRLAGVNAELKFCYVQVKYIVIVKLWMYERNNERNQSPGYKLIWNSKNIKPKYAFEDPIQYFIYKQYFYCKI